MQNLLAIVRADEAVDDVARYCLAHGIAALTTFHRIEISSFTSNGSPFLTRFGTLIRTLTMASLSIHASGQRDQQIDAVTPTTAIGQLGHRDDRS